MLLVLYDIMAGSAILTASNTGGAVGADTVAVESPVNLAPIANNGEVSIAYNGSIVFSLASLVTDDNNSINWESVIITSAPLYGTYELSGTGAISLYYAGSNYAGMDSFSFTVEDTSGLASNEASVPITVNNEVVIPLSIGVISVNLPMMKLAI